MGRVEAICVSPQKGTAKHPVSVGQFLENWGLEGDAHGGLWHRQISILAAETIEAFRRDYGVDVQYGDFGENLVLQGIDAAALPVGTKLQCGAAALEITQIGKECHQSCAIRSIVGDCIMPRSGVFARVIHGGAVRPGDAAHILETGNVHPYKAAVITLSDKGSRHERVDTSGPTVVRRLEQAGYTVVETLLLPDGEEPLKTELCRLADQEQVDLILTTGGTGFSLRDVTPEATLAVATRLVPGIAEAMRAASMTITRRAMLSRAVSVIRGRTVIINLPGSPKACEECMDVFMSVLSHGLDVLRGDAGDCGMMPNEVDHAVEHKEI